MLVIVAVTKLTNNIKSSPRKSRGGSLNWGWARTD